MTATDDAREALADHRPLGDGGCSCGESDPCPPTRLARTLLALTGEQAVEAAARAIRDEACPNTPPCETCCEAQALVAITAALAAAKEAR